VSVRFGRIGTGVTQDHNELTNRGTRTHAEIDSYMDELDGARGMNPSISDRFTEVETDVDTQTASISALDTRVDGAEADIITVSTIASDTQAEINVARGGQASLDARLDSIESAQAPPVTQEVINARTSSVTGVYPNLKSRLDYMETHGSVGGASSVVVVDNVANLPVTGDTSILYVVRSDASLGNKPSLYVYKNSAYVLVSGGGSSGGGGGSVSQFTKLDVTAPYSKDIEIPFDINLALTPVEVLKFIAGSSDQVKSLFSFSNSDATSFDNHPTLVFDGTMHFLTTYSYPMVDEGSLGTGKMWSQDIDRANFLAVESLGVN
jgi:hypothetical protein